MTAQKRIEAAKGAVFGLLYDAYKRGDKIAFIVFRGESSETLIPSCLYASKAAIITGFTTGDADNFG